MTERVEKPFRAALGWAWVALVLGLYLRQFADLAPAVLRVLTP